MAKRKRNYEIWDNHWKDAPTWSFLLLLLSVFIVMALSFQGGMMILKGDFLLAGIASVIIGILIYILIYKIIQLRTSSNAGSNAKGVFTSCLLLIPFSGFVFFGGAALCNELGFIKAQQSEFQKIESEANHSFSLLETYFLTANSKVQTTLQSECKACSAMSSRIDRTNSATDLSNCYGTSRALGCISSTPALLDELDSIIKQKFQVKSESQLAIESFLSKAQDMSLSSRLYQFSIQSEALHLDSLFKEVQNHQSNVLASYDCISFATSPTLSSLPRPTMDCSNYNSVFCVGWGWDVALALFLILFACLTPILFADYSEKFDSQKESESGGISMKI